MKEDKANDSKEESFGDKMKVTWHEVSEEIDDKFEDLTEEANEYFQKSNKNSKRRVSCAFMKVSDFFEKLSNNETVVSYVTGAFYIIFALAATYAVWRVFL